MKEDTGMRCVSSAQLDAARPPVRARRLVRALRWAVLAAAAPWLLSDVTSLRRLDASAQTFDFITVTHPSPGVDVFRIDRPDPTRSSTEYPSITFQPGDAVLIQAGGCVQSGGLGNTWHRYVNPTGGKADKLYHGLITIPFATGVLERIERYENQVVHVDPNAPPGRLHLQLGFEDDNYGDNGYYSHDNGPDDQCKGPAGGSAWVLLTVTHSQNAGTPTPVGASHDWDIELSGFDDNGLPLNPRWASQVSHPTVNGGLPDPAACSWPWAASSPGAECTTQPTTRDTYDLCEWFSSNYGFGGHLNWIAATYTGTVAWEEKSPPLQDDEYSINVTTDNGNAGATAARPDGMHIEFDSDETVDPITDDLGIGWWKAFHAAVDNGNAAAHALIDNDFAIVTGLIGVDFAHTPGGESHPVWALAMRVRDDPSDETWAVFVRNWGNEGYCSGDQHYIDYLDDQYTFRLPWPAGATSVSVLMDPTQFSANQDGFATPEVAFVPNTGVFLTFKDIPAARSHPLIAGELHLAWTFASQPHRPPLHHVPLPGPGRMPARVATGAVRDHRGGAPEADVAEAFVAKAFATLPKEKRDAILKALGPARVAVRPIPLRARVVPFTAVRRIGHPRVWQEVDPGLVARRNRQLELLKAAYGGKVPGMPEKRLP
jgi:hypothetical protein